MDGGLDKAIDDFFHGEPQSRAKAAIAETWCGELPVGAALVVEMRPRSFAWLVVAPTMRVPGAVSNSLNAYLAMRALLIAVLQHKKTPAIRNVAVPGLCTGVGAMPYEGAARQMRAAYDSVIGDEWRDVVHSALAPFAVEGWTFRRT